MVCEFQATKCQLSVSAKPSNPIRDDGYSQIDDSARDHATLVKALDSLHQRIEQGDVSDQSTDDGFLGARDIVAAVVYYTLS